MIDNEKELEAQSLRFILQAALSKLGELSHLLTQDSALLPEILKKLQDVAISLREAETMAEMEHLLMMQDLASYIPKSNETSIHHKPKEEEAETYEDYLVVPDKEKKSTWQLRVKQNGKPSLKHMRAAWAALTVGLMGNKVKLPEGVSKESILNKLKKMFHSMGLATPSEKKEGITDEDIKKRMG